MRIFNSRMDSLSTYALIVVYLPLGFVLRLLPNGGSVEISTCYRFRYAYREEAEVCGRRSLEAGQEPRTKLLVGVNMRAFPPSAESSLPALTAFVDDVEVVTMFGFPVAIKASRVAEMSRHVARIKTAMRSRP